MDLISETLPIRRRDTLEVLLNRAGLDRAATVKAISAVKEAFDVRKFRAGSHLTFARTQDGILESIEYIIDPDNKLQLLHFDDNFVASIVEVPGTISTVPVRGTLKGSLFESMERAGERPELAIEMAEIFAWSLDFYRDPREGDEFNILVEKKVYDNGQPPTYKRILAAEYNNSGTVFDAYMFPGPDGKPYYYSGDGRSLQSAFLRSPLKFQARVSSNFSHRRLHPVLKVYRPHYGTDYAAPTGTPVHSVAAGRVTSSSRDRANGNIVKIRHANGFETMYLHLSKRLVRAGDRVEQGQRIGLVGATGLVTGAHLDFRLKKNGRFVNFRSLRLPPVATISEEQSEEFAAARERMLALMKPDTLADTIVAAD